MLCQSARLDVLEQGMWATKVVLGPGLKPKEVADHQNRKGFLEMACKMAGDLKPEGEAPNGDKISLAILILNERERRGLEQMPAEFLNTTAERRPDAGSI